MTTPSREAMGPGVRSPFTRAVVVLLTLAALLIGVFALHSMTGAHAGAVEQTASHSHESSTAAHSDETVADSGVSVAAAVFDVTGVPVMPCDDNCAECGLMAAICASVFVLASLVLLVRFPAMYALVLEAGPRLRMWAPRTRFHVYFPSLAVLSISRT